ncbi:hypothetical protein CLOM621_06151 [Clostridium sp. M62/1]|nr:hypothetical protein CLOM621_06151 [Clostridium sp. M62/1]
MMIYERNEIFLCLLLQISQPPKARKNLKQFPVSVMFSPAS